MLPFFRSRKSSSRKSKGGKERTIDNDGFIPSNHSQIKYYLIDKIKEFK